MSNVTHLATAAAPPVVQPVHRGRLPKNVTRIRKGEFMLKCRREAEAEAEAAQAPRQELEALSPEVVAAIWRLAPRDRYWLESAIRNHLRLPQLAM